MVLPASQEQKKIPQGNQSSLPPPGAPAPMLNINIDEMLIIYAGKERL